MFDDTALDRLAKLAAIDLDATGAPDRERMRDDLEALLRLLDRIPEPQGSAPASRVATGLDRLRSDEPNDHPSVALTSAAGWIEADLAIPARDEEQ